MITLTDQQTTDLVTATFWVTIGGLIQVAVHNLGCDIADWRDRRKARHRP